MRTLGSLLLLLTLTAFLSPAATQDVPHGAHPETLDLPLAVASAVVDFYNDPRRLRYEGDARIRRDEMVRRDIAVLEGALRIEGRVEGSIVVVNGDIELAPGASVTGDLLVVGGVITGAGDAMVAGEILSYPGRLEYRHDGRSIRRVDPPAEPTAGRVAGRVGGRSPIRSDVLLTTGKSYNRVEGLPITFGPRVEVVGRNPFRLQALAIYRTEAGFTLDPDRMGYHLRAEQFLGGRQELRLGAAAYSIVDPIEEWHLSNLENGLATFLFHQDYRDHYQREGVSLSALWEPGLGSLSLGADLRRESHRSVASGSPWTLFQNAEPWRQQPLIAEGGYRAVGVQAIWDTRGSPTDPSTGSYLVARMEQSFGGDLTLPRSVYRAPDQSTPPGELERSYGTVRQGTIDLRSYNRIDPRSRLNLRVLAGSSLDGNPLPPQRQFALGGAGSLPGYSLFSRDCGARDRVVNIGVGEGHAEYFPAYGCDAFALFQAEFRGKLSFRLLLDSAWGDDREAENGWGLNLDVSPDWVFFLNAGRGWAYEEPRYDEPWAVDVGLGILVNRLGLYAAAPLRGEGGVNLFIRLGPRF